MLLTPKVVLVILDPSPAGRRRAAHAASFARRWRLHLVGVHMAFAGIEWPASMNYVRGDRGIEEVAAYRHQYETKPEIATRAIGEHFGNLCAEYKVSYEFHSIGRERSAA